METDGHNAEDRVDRQTDRQTDRHTRAHAYKMGRAYRSRIYVLEQQVIWAAATKSDVKGGYVTKRVDYDSDAGDGDVDDDGECNSEHRDDGGGVEMGRGREGGIGRDVMGGGGSTGSICLVWSIDDGLEASTLGSEVR